MVICKRIRALFVIQNAVFRSLSCIGRTSKQRHHNDEYSRLAFLCNASAVTFNSYTQLSGRQISFLACDIAMALPQEVKYACDVEWIDPVTGVAWKYQLNYYIESGEIEMVRFYEWPYAIILSCNWMSDQAMIKS